MPPLNAKSFAMLGYLVFISKQFKMPTKADYKKPPDMQQYTMDSMSMADHIPPPPSHMMPGPWFTPQTPANKHYQKSCDDIGKKWQEFVDNMLDAVDFSHNMWRLQAKIKDLQVAAVSAIGAPGCLDGPELESNIKGAPMVAAWSGNAGKLRDAVAKGVSKCFKDWQGKVMVPGLPWYPAFAAFPSPSAPPMPNVPMPLIACPSAMMSAMIVPATLKDEMVKALDGGVKDKDGDKHYEAAFEAIATAIAMAFPIWLASQQVMLVMGKGPIPTFAPPYVPVGPVLGGDNIAAPGHLMA
jgi:hypothetical protein